MPAAPGSKVAQLCGLASVLATLVSTWQLSCTTFNGSYTSYSGIVVIFYCPFFILSGQRLCCILFLTSRQLFWISQHGSYYLSFTTFHGSYTSYSGIVVIFYCPFFILSGQRLCCILFLTSRQLFWISQHGQRFLCAAPVHCDDRIACP